MKIILLLVKKQAIFVFFKKSVNTLMVHMKKIQTKMNTFNVPVTTVGQRLSYKVQQLTKDNLGKSYEASNVTLLSSRGTLQEVMHILLWGSAVAQW